MSTISFKKAKTILLAASLFFYSAVKSQCPCPGNLISQQEYLTYTANYNSFFIQGASDKKHTKWIYIPKQYFEFLNNFLSSSINSDGIWIYFLSYGYILDPRQQTSADQLLFNIVASENKKPNFTTLKNYLGSSTTLDSYRLELSTRRVSGTSTLGVNQIIKREKAYIVADTLRYKLTNPDVKYSERLFICKQQIQQVLQYTNSMNFNGIKLYFASYNTLFSCVQNKDPKQFTLLLAPVKNKNSEPDFNAYNNFFLNKLHMQSAEIYNHGSLCPNDCTQN